MLVFLGSLVAVITTWTESENQSAFGTGSDSG